MGKYLLIGFLITMSYCEMPEEPTPVWQVPDVIEPYIQRFIKEAAARGHTIEVDQLVVEFESPIGNDNPSGNCSNGPGLPAPLIKLDTTLIWWRLGDMTREEVIFHELGHCILGQSHRNELLSNGEPVSLMRAESPLLYLFIEPADINLSFKRDYYLDELFDQGIEIPCWVQSDQPAQSDLLWIDDSEFGFRNLLIDHEGEVWASDFSRLVRFNGTDQLETIVGPKEFDIGTGNTITLDGQGQLWVAKENNGFTSIWKHQGELQFEMVGEPFPLIGIRSMEFDEGNNLWLAPANGQLVFFDQQDSSLAVFNAENSSLPSGFIRGLTSAGTNSVYLVINGQLVWGQADSQFEVFNPENSNLPAGNIKDLITDKDGQLWVVINDRLARLREGRTFEVFDMIDLNLPHSRINTIALDPNDDIWLGTSIGLRYLKSGNRFTSYCDYFLGESNNNVTAIAFDIQGNVWTKSKAIVRQRIAIGS